MEKSETFEKRKFQKKYKCNSNKIICGAGSDEVYSNDLSVIFKSKKTKL
jgi:hypothetical protein